MVCKTVAGLIAGAIVAAGGASARADGEADRLTDLELLVRAEQRRVELIERVTPGVVCILDEKERGGGSGVIIDPQGYGLTNFHVIAGMLKSREGFAGLPDGTLAPLQVLGIDPTGDVAMFRLSGRDSFPYVPLGDSDAVELGDRVYVLGNAFMLSEDYTPTVTAGIVTGVHRYQYGVGANLVYSDCIQTDAAINPGNSGGPLINTHGEVVGINGRISINTRGRYNVGLGYAISSNQIKRFMPALRAGLLAKHGTLRAEVDAVEGRGTVFSDVFPGHCAHRAGIRTGDKLLKFDGRSIRSRNEFASILGTYPANWPVPLTIEQNGRQRELVVRLDPLEPRLRGAFHVEPEVNREQVERVLRRFQRTVYGDRTANPPVSWKAQIRREEPARPGGEAKPVKRYELSLESGEAAELRRVFDESAAGDLIEFDVRTAQRRAAGNDEPFALTPDAAITLNALFVMHTALIAPMNDADLTQVTHAGSDRLLGAAQERLLEVLSWPMGEDARARFGFDVETGRLVQAVVHEVDGETSVTLRFEDPNDIGGLIWPNAVHVDGPGYEYRDTYSDWEVSW